MTPQHLLIAPILIPLVAGAVMLLYEDRQRQAKFTISLISCVALLLVAIDLMNRSKGAGPSGDNDVGVYLLGNWPSPFGIVLVLDRLSALMLLLTACLSIAALVYSWARWQKMGQHFHSLFQFLLMGLNGAFLTGDLFNLFVFFEVLLAASYGLLLHGSGRARVRAGLHYIAMNLAASLLFLIGVSLIYGVTGTLNMAALAARIPELSPADRPMMEAGAAILGVAFLVKAGMWPLSFWLSSAYMSAAAPVAAMFSIMTKVGVYVVLRLHALLFGMEAGPSAGFGTSVLIAGGMLSIAFGMLGVLASQALGRLAAFSVIVSSGTLLTVIGLSAIGGGSTAIAGALYYMMASTIALAALFLLVELLEREQGSLATILAVTAEAYGIAEEEPEEGEAEVGIVLPGTMTVLGVCFVVCALLLAGLPPLAGFVGKFAMLAAVLNPGGMGIGAEIPRAAWWFTALVILSGLAALIALVRTGIHTFWAPVDETVPRIQVVEIAPIIALLLLTVGLTVQARPVMRYLEATAHALAKPQIYVHAVLNATSYDPLAPGPDVGGPPIAAGAATGEARP